MSYVVLVKSKMKISQSFVAFSEYVNYEPKLIALIFYFIRNSLKIQLLSGFLKNFFFAMIKNLLAKE